MIGKLDKRFVYCLNKLKEDNISIQFVGELPCYRNFDEQLKLFMQGRETEVFQIEEKFPFGKKLLRLADSGQIRTGTVTNATPCTSPHNFGLAIDCLNAEKLCNIFNSYMGYDCFETGKDFKDYNHIQIKGFKIPKYDFRWSLFASPSGYRFLEKIGGLFDD